MHAGGVGHGMRRDRGRHAAPAQRPSSPGSETRRASGSGSGRPGRRRSESGSAAASPVKAVGQVTRRRPHPSACRRGRAPTARRTGADAGVEALGRLQRQGEPANPHRQRLRRVVLDPVRLVGDEPGVGHRRGRQFRSLHEQRPVRRNPSGPRRGARHRSVMRREQLRLRPTVRASPLAE